MLEGLVHLHSLLRWIVLILLVWTMIDAFAKRESKTAKFLTISAHTMLLLGLIQWFIGEYGLKAIKELGMGELMKLTAQRFYTIEHPLMMIIGIVFITIGGSWLKQGKSGAKWMYLAALLVILSRIPWPFMEHVGRSLIPGAPAC